MGDCCIAFPARSSWGRLSSLPLETIPRLAGWKACPTGPDAHRLRPNCLSFFGQDVVVFDSHGVTTITMTKKTTKTSRNPAEYPILGVLYRGPIHGYDICRVLGDGIGSIWRLGKSQVYALLMRLEREGLVIHERVGQDNLPAKNIFSLTEQGADVFGQWLNLPVLHVRDMRLEFLTKLWFARQVDLQMEKKLIEAQLAMCREKAGALEKLKRSRRNEIDGLSAGFRLNMVQAAISWLEDIRELRNGPRSDTEMLFTEGK